MRSVEAPFQRGTLSNEKLIAFYKALVYPRLTEEKMLNLLRQGKISKWFSGIGQEVIAVGATLALDKDSFFKLFVQNQTLENSFGIPGFFGL